MGAISEFADVVRSMLARMTPIQVCYFCTASTGLIGWLLMTEYVRASELTPIHNEFRAGLRENWLMYAEDKMLTLRRFQCETQNGLKSGYSERIAELQRKYYEKTGHSLALPDCSEL